MSKIYIDREDRDAVNEWAWLDKYETENAVRLGIDHDRVFVSNGPDESMTFTASDIPHLIKALQCAQQAIEGDY